MNDINKFVDVRQACNMLHNMILAPTGNLGVPRNQMPQIDNQHRAAFETFLMDEGVDVRVIRVPTRSLKLVQGEYNRDKVVSIILSGNARGLPIYVSKDGYVLDGNHRLIAQMNMPGASSYITVVEIGLDARACLELIEEFPLVRYRKLNENK